MKIRAEHLVKAYKGRKVVKDVSFEVEQGQIVGLLGPNGAGKTTSFYMIIGLVKPNGGRVLLDEKEITNWPMYKRARAGISYLAQEKSVFRRLTVRDNIRMVLEIAGKGKKEIESKIDELVSELHIGHILDQMGGVLSGGETRRVEIARALANEPNFILLDEPFTGIDPVTIEEIQKIISKLKQRGIGILITDHNVAATLNITDYNHILIDGVIHASGGKQDILGNREVISRYLGEGFSAQSAGVAVDVN